MPLSISISIDPTTGTTTTASFEVAMVLTYSGVAPTGSVTPYVNGAPVGAAIPLTGDESQSFAVGLNNPTAPGNYSVLVRYGGDSTYPGTLDSNTETFTVTGATTATRQAVAMATCDFVVGAAPSRADRENGVLGAEGYKVTAIALSDGGTGQYDGYTVGKLVGKVAGVFTAQALTVTLDDAGGLASLTGFDTTTVWDKVPRVIITRWSGSGPTADFLGY